MLGNIFGPDLGIIVIIVVVVLLGGSQLPKIARNVGTAGKEFRKAQQEAEADADRDLQAKAAQEGGQAAAQPVAAIPATTTEAPPASPGGPQVPPAAGAVAPEGSISLTPAQLDALLKAREDQVRKETSPDN